MGKFNKLQLESLDKQIKQANCPRTPNGGWLKAIRTALKMPLSAVASRIGVSSQAVSQAEKLEDQGSISISQLNKIANAMGFELHYALKPIDNKSINDVIKAQAMVKAKQIVDKVDITMTIEDQKVTSSKQSIEQLANELADNLNSKLWQDD